MTHLAILSHPAVPHVAFGWFNLSWPNIAFWLAVVLFFAVFTWARIPHFMEADAATRRKEAEK